MGVNAKREDGLLLQKHGETGETRAHWHTDDGGGRWVNFVSWWKFDGKWTGLPAHQISENALRRLVGESPAGPETPVLEPR